MTNVPQAHEFPHPFVCGADPILLMRFLFGLSGIVSRFAVHSSIVFSFFEPLLVPTSMNSQSRLFSLLGVMAVLGFCFGLFRFMILVKVLYSLCLRSSLITASISCLGLGNMRPTAIFTRQLTGVSGVRLP